MSCRLLPGVYRRMPIVWSLGLLALLLLPAHLRAQDAVDPQTITLDAIDRLRFVQEIEPEAAPEIEVVIEHLARTVQGTDGTSLLLDSCHLVSAPQGLAAWIEVRQAVLQLQLLLDQANRKNPRISLSLAVQGLLTDVRDDLVHAYRFLAAVAVQEAQAFTDEASAATQADLAARRLADAEEQIAAGEIVRGLQSLRQAWEHAQLAIEVDLTADSPLINLETPADGATVFSSPVDVAGMVQLLTLGTVGADDVVVTVNGQTAEVVQRSFLARDVPLREGLNAVVGVARSSEGGVGTACAGVRFDPSDRPQIVAAGGTDQAATISTLLPEPLTVRITDVLGNPLAGEQVIFRVVQGDGTLSGGVRGTVVETDADGIASTGFTLGSRAGVAVNRVRATAVGIEGDVVFSPTALTSEAARIHAVSGDNQRGLVGEPLALPLVAVVTDEGQNLVAGAPVTFEVVGGGGSVGGEPQTEVATDSDGRAAVSFTLGPEPGLDAHLVRATFPGLAREPVTFKASGFVAGDPADTRILGVVLDGQGDPVPGVTLSVEGADGAVRADADGQFVLTGVPVGEVNLEMDGSTATRPGIWSSLSFHLHTLPGVDNRLPKPIFTLPLDVDRGKVVGGPEDVTVEIPEVPGFSLTVLAGSATFSDGSSTGVVSVTPVHADKIPMSPGSGMQPRFIVTVQPAGVHFDPPAPVTYPNVDGLPAGAVTEMFSFDHDLGEFVSIGTGTVSEDGTEVRSDPGFGIVKAGWHCAAPQSESGAGSSLRVEITTPGPVTLEEGLSLGLEALGDPSRDVELSWSIADSSIASIDSSSSFRWISSPDSALAGATVTGGSKAGRTTATATIRCTTTGETDSDDIEVLVVRGKIDEVFSEQIPDRECNMLPPPSKPAKNTPMLMGGLGGNAARISIRSTVEPAGGESKVRVGVREAGGSVMLGDAQAQATPGKARVNFTASHGLNLYEAVIGLDKNQDGSLQGNEIQNVFPDTIRVTTTDDYTDGIFLVETQDTFLVGVAQDVVDVFLAKEDSLPGTTVGTRRLKSTTMTHPLGAPWDSTCNADLKQFTFKAGSEVAENIAATDLVEDLIKADLGTHREKVQRFFVEPGSPDIAIFPAALGEPAWDWGGIVNAGEWLPFHPAFFGAFGSVTFTGKITEVEVEKGSLNVLRIRYSGAFDDLYDFDFTDPLTRAAAAVQSGFPTLGRAGNVFWTRVEIDREAFRLPMGGFRYSFQ